MFSLEYILSEVVPRLKFIILAPKSNPDMMWIVTPLIVSAILMQFYFGRHKEESLGWNTAYGNSIILIFVSLNMLQHLKIVNTVYDIPKIFSLGISQSTELMLIFSILAWAIFLMIMEFFHWIPEKLAFFLSSGIIINSIAYATIIMIYSNLPADKTTLFAFLLFLAIIYIIFKILKFLIPTSLDSKRKKILNIAPNSPKKNLALEKPRKQFKKPLL